MALIRRGHHGAFEALVQRYQPRLLAFCRHMLASREDAEDVLQEVFAAAFNAICADDRPINARPWLYRIARNRCLNHLRRASPRARTRWTCSSATAEPPRPTPCTSARSSARSWPTCGELPETQRTALLLREIDALSYDQIAEAMDTTVPSVKSLLVRARVSLAEAAEARLLTCDEVRLELGAVAEGINRTSAPLRRHLKTCERCRTFRVGAAQDLEGAGRRLPDRPADLHEEAVDREARLRRSGRRGRLLVGRRRRRRGGGVAGAAAGGMAGAAGGITAGGAVSAGLSTIASKAAAGMAAAVIVTAGAVEVKNVRDTTPAPARRSPPLQPARAPAVGAGPARRPARQGGRGPGGEAAHRPPADNEAAAPAAVDPAPPTPETPGGPADAPPCPRPCRRTAPW